MKRKQNKGFTIVELVIVLAVIGILATLLIPSFSSTMKKANLSADKTAVREMNMALAADESINGKPTSIETVMQVLANAGYNSENWVCLTAGYEVYWYSTDNRLVLYNASTAEIEYPTTYSVKSLVTSGNEFLVYNDNHVKAVNTNLSLGSADSSTTKNISELGSNSETATGSQKAMSSVSESLVGDNKNDALRSALDITGNDVYVYGSRSSTKTIDTNVTVNCEILSVGDTATVQIDNLKSNGDLKENIYYIYTEVTGKEITQLTSEEKAQVEKKTGDYVYSIFTQMNTGQITSDACIVFPKETDTVINVSGKEWSAVKEFTGYFGTTDDQHPIIIDGAELTSNTGYSQTVSFTGSQSKYFVTGFFGTVYGNATIENVTFKNIKINQPAMDFEITKYQINGKAIDSRNSISIIGGITDKASHVEANVKIRNIVVEDSCEFTCGAQGGGLIGYIGSAEDKGKLSGNILIENCKIGGKISSSYDYVSEAYGPIGGMIGLFCRADYVNCTIKDCTVNNEINGTTQIGGVIGDAMAFTSIKFAGNNDFSGVKLNTADTAHNTKALIGAMTNAKSSSVTLEEGATVKYNAENCDEAHVRSGQVSTTYCQTVTGVSQELQDLIDSRNTAN